MKVETEFILADDGLPRGQIVGDGVPKRWSVLHLDDGTSGFCEHVPLCWLWAFPVALALPGIGVCASAFLSSHWKVGLNWPAFFVTIFFAVAVFACPFALYRLTARRYLLKRDALVVVSRWFGFIPVRRRTFVRTAITQVVSYTLPSFCRNHAVVWCNGYDFRYVWVGRDGAVAEFIKAHLSAQLDFSRERPLSDDVAGHQALRFRMKYRPRDIVEIPGGFECREGRWWNCTFRMALLQVLAVYFLAGMVAGVMKQHAFFQGHVHALSAVLISLAALALAYLAWCAALGRFGVHCAMVKNGRLAYFHGIGRWGRRVEWPLDAIDCFGVTYSGPFAKKYSAVAIRVKGGRRGACIFCDLPPICYHWVEGWLYGQMCQ